MMKFSPIYWFFFFLFLSLIIFLLVRFKYCLVSRFGGFMFPWLRERVFSKNINKCLFFSCFRSLHKGWFGCSSMDHCGLMKFWAMMNPHFISLWHLWWKCFIKLWNRNRDGKLFLIEGLLELDISVHLFLKCLFADFIQLRRGNRFGWFLE